MRTIHGLVALALLVAGCSGEDGKDGRNGADGAAGPAGKDGRNGEDGAVGPAGPAGPAGADGTNGTNGTDGEDGEDGEDGADGAAFLQGAGAPGAGLGADGDTYLDTTSRDLYQKSSGTWTVIANLSGGPAGPAGPAGPKGDPGDPGDDGDDGASVRSGAGAPAAGLGADGDVYIDSTNGDLYTKSAGAWTKTGSLQGPAGEDVKDTVGGVRWFAFGLSASYAYTPTLVTSQAFTAESSTGTFTFTGEDQHGRLGFATVGSYFQGGVDLSTFESLSFSATVTGGATKNLVVLLTSGDNIGCQWALQASAGPDYSIDIDDPDSCYPAADSLSLESVTNVQIGIVSSGAGARTLSVTSIKLDDTL